MFKNEADFFYHVDLNVIIHIVHFFLAVLPIWRLGLNLKDLRLITAQIYVLYYLKSELELITKHVDFSENRLHIHHIHSYSHRK